MSKEQIGATLERFATAAGLVERAGFDAEDASRMKVPTAIAQTLLCGPFRMCRFGPRGQYGQTTDAHRPVSSQHYDFLQTVVRGSDNPSDPTSLCLTMARGRSSSTVRDHMRGHQPADGGAAPALPATERVRPSTGSRGLGRPNSQALCLVY